MTVAEALKRARERLERAGVDPSDARLETEVLLARALGISRAALIAERGGPVHEITAALFDDAIARRERREPFAYVIGEREFRSMRFAVGPGVLIPRPDTETLVDEALAELARLRQAVADKAPLRILDVGTGAGVVAVSLAKEGPGPLAILATDVSPTAVAVARENARHNRVLDRVRVVQADLAPDDLADGSLDLIASNPPYVTAVEHADLAPEVREHEPPEALLDPCEEPDGLGLTQKIAALARRLLAPGGALAVEVGAGRAEAAGALIARLGLEVDRVVRDLGGVERVVVARQPRTG